MILANIIIRIICPRRTTAQASALLPKRYLIPASVRQAFLTITQAPQPATTTNAPADAITTAKGARIHAGGPGLTKGTAETLSAVRRKQRLHARLTAAADQ